MPSSIKGIGGGACWMEAPCTSDAGLPVELRIDDRQLCQSVGNYFFLAGVAAGQSDSWKRAEATGRLVRFSVNS